MRSFVIVLFFAGPAWATTCPPAPDHSDAVAAVLEQVRAAQDETSAKILSNQLWEFWADAPDEHAQALLDRGMQMRAGFDFQSAMTAFDELIAYCPDYAEGFNQRAFVSFIRQDYVAALEDLDRALERNPGHVAALAGKALTLMQLGRIKAGQAILREALALNPWLPERGYLIESPAEDEGAEDI